MGGVEGVDGETKHNWYDRLMENVQSEIEKLFELCIHKVAQPPQKGYTRTRFTEKEANLAWKNEIT